MWCGVCGVEGDEEVEVVSVLQLPLTLQHSTMYVCTYYHSTP